MKKILLLAIVTAPFLAQGREIQGVGKPGAGLIAGNTAGKTSALCGPATSQSDLNVNNVRATILGGGDMWWDLNQAQYEVPKGGGRHVMFAGALWLGGIDDGGQLKLAAQTYRQNGNDYWPGPLSTDGLASIDQATCALYDRHFRITREEVEIHRAWLLCKEDPNCDPSVSFPGYAIPLSIQNWPGNGINGDLPFTLAPFFDRDGNQSYDPNIDFPGYDLDNQFDCRSKEVDVLYGDQTLWWVYNDRGNVHTESQAAALGFEIRAQAFGFATNDEVNNMTFYNYRILNRSTFRLTNTYFSTWFDPDLGNATDDIIGSDIPRGLGYCYNSDANDEGPLGYGANPPAVGFDFFQGPFADYFDGLDNDRDGCVDGVRDGLGNCIAENPALGINERIIMSHFMYYNNTQDLQGNPTNATEFYQYMRARWRNNNPLVVETPCGPGCNTNGDGFTTDGSGTETRYAYPGVTFDTTGAFAPTSPWPNGGWYESPSNRQDKRGLHSAGPFSLAPGALNFVTTGVIFARNFLSTDLFASVNLVILADDKAQNLFDNCFQVLNGPAAPNVTIRELDRELIFTLEYAAGSNNFNFRYRELDPAIPDPTGPLSAADSVRYFNYVFEGFQIFQLRDRNVSLADIYNPALATMVAQCDIRNGVVKLINEFPDQTLGFVRQDMTLSEDNNGIKMSFRFTDDAFAQGDRRLVNHRTYFYTVVAYGVNQFDQFPEAPAQTRQTKPYLAGRLNNRVYQALPHIPTPREGGSALNSTFGESPEITRIEGVGNSGNFLEITDASRDEILANSKADFVTYQRNAGPLRIQVVDPMNVPMGKYAITFNGVGPNAKWQLTTADNSQVIATADTTIQYAAEQIIPSLGISIIAEDALMPGGDDENAFNNGFIGADIVYSEVNRNWLGFINDDASFSPTNYILAGPNTSVTDQPGLTYKDFFGDRQNIYGNILNGQWGPGPYLSSINAGANSLGMGLYPVNGRPTVPIPGTTDSRPDMSNVHSVDIVLTRDPSKWTRVPVFELSESQDLLVTEKALKLNLRNADSWALVNGQLVRDPNLPKGWSYFPGYAIDLETGQRLNMAFGENSWLVGQRGNDMLWNPTQEVFQLPGNPENGGFVLGGQHYIYVWGSEAVISPTNRTPLPYNGDDPNDHPLFTDLNNLATSLQSRIRLARSIMWGSIPVIAPGNWGNLNPYTSMPSELTIKLRMNRPFENFVTNNSNNGNPRYEFSLDDLATTKNNNEIAQNALEIIRVVPNPYLGWSEYNQSQLDDIVKITNLPRRCDISIYSPDGALIKTIRKDSEDTWVLWDLKNNVGVPIASGVYIIHVNAPGVGERILKFFGSMRPVDLNAF